MPAFTACNDFAPVKSRSLKNTFPEVGCTDPATMLNRVVLPAPFGPISPQIWPSASSKLTSFSAASPAKYFVRPSTIRRGATRPLSRFSSPSGNLVQQPQDAARLEKDDQDQQYSVKQEVKLRKRGNQLLLHEADRKSTRLNSSHSSISYAVFC